MLGDLDQHLVSRLQREEKTAQEQLQDAHKKYNEIMSDLGVVPHPDGSLRIQKAGAELRLRNRESAEATRRLMEYVVHGKVPEGY